MSYFINRIYVENFKLIEEGDLSFNKSNLVILDGPNGYGKTTIFDIIELAIVGRINRIDLNQTNNSSGCNDILYLKNQNKDAIIKVEFISDDKRFTVVKRIDSNKRYNRNDRKSNNWGLFETYLLDDFKDEFSEDKKANPEKIIDILGGDYLERFYNLFYYVQQEDSSVFLKNSEKKRVEVISKLFDVDKEQAEQNKLITFREKVNLTIRSLKNKKQKLDTPVEVDLNKESLKYNKAIKWKNINWDRANVNIESKARLDEYKLEIQNIRQFCDNAEEFFKYEINNKIKDCLSTEGLLKSYIVCKNFHKEYIDIREKYENMKFVLESKIAYDSMKIEEIFKVDKFKLFKLLKKEHDYEFIEEYDKCISDLKTLNKNKSNLEKHINNINIHRKYLNPADKNTYIDINKVEENKCVLCGNTYESKDELINQINNYTKYLESLVGESYHVNKSAMNTIKDIMSNKVLKEIDTYLNEPSNLVDEEFFKQLDMYMTIFKKNINTISLFETIGIDCNGYINKECSYIDNLDVKYQKLRDYVELQKFEISQEYIVLDREINFKNIFNIIFDRNKENIKVINIQILEEKVEYLTNQYYNKELDKIKFNKDIDVKIEKLEKLIENTIKPSIEIYTTSMRSHYTKIIKDIEIPLYIYSGKIIQDYQRGLGIFIKEYDELKNLKFVSNNNSDHDAINYLSSGQLSALIISFTLALNKVYGNKEIKTILIDDPVQTMDDINMMSFIELIRNEFEDKQIIISTHEDSVSLFMRYKFLMYDLKETRINVKSAFR